MLLPAFDAWRSGDDASPTIARPARSIGYSPSIAADRRYTKLDAHQAQPRAGFQLVGGYVLRDGRRLGPGQLARSPPRSPTRSTRNCLPSDGRQRQRDRGERRTTVNHAMKTCRRAWNVAARRNPASCRRSIRSRRWGCDSSDRETPTATYDELQAFRAKAVEMGLPSLATAALIGWEWLQREDDIFASFDVAHYRPKERPTCVRVIHEKTQEENWVPLFEDAACRSTPN